MFRSVVSNPCVGEKVPVSLASLLQDWDSLVTDFSLLHRQVFLVMSESASSPLLFSSWEYKVDFLSKFSHAWNYGVDHRNFPYLLFPPQESFFFGFG